MTERTVRCECAGYLLEMRGIDYEDIPEFLQTEAAAGRRIVNLAESPYRPQAAVQIRAGDGSHICWELTVAEDCPSGFDAGDVACFASRLALAIGKYVVCFQVPTGELLWATECDSVCCFGVHALDAEPTLIAHGEIDVSKLSYGGDILWRTFGQDIFTGPFEIEDDGIRAVDFEGTVYWIRLDTGESQIIGHGEPPWPHH